MEERVCQLEALLAQFQSSSELQQKMLSEMATELSAFDESETAYTAQIENLNADVIALQSVVAKLKDDLQDKDFQLKIALAEIVRPVKVDVGILADVEDEHMMELCLLKKENARNEIEYKEDLAAVRKENVELKVAVRKLEAQPRPRREMSV